MSGGDGYRCDACRRKRNRCETCRAARAAAQRATRAAKRKAGTCLQCSEDALPGMTLCAYHRAQNNGISAASHAARRST